MRQPPSSQLGFNNLPRRRFLAAMGLWPAIFSNVAQGEPKTDRWLAHELSESHRTSIRSELQAGLKEGFIPGGSCALIHRGETVFREAFGMADVATQRPFEVDTPCRIASLTKPHTATVLVQLASQGKLSLDAPVSQYLPYFQGVKLEGDHAARRAPTLRECLSHTAGFPGNDAIKSGRLEMEWQGSLQSTVRELAKLQLLGEPGTLYDYSRLGFMVAGCVAEVVTGKSFGQVLHEELLLPIGAVTASFEPPASVLEDIAISYERTRNGFVIREGERISGKVINPGGGLVSTLDDVSQLMLLHRNQGLHGSHQLVPAAALAEMYIKQPGTQGTGYGLGFNIIGRKADGSAARIQHTGASGTIGILDFERDLIVVLLTQVPQLQTNRWRNRLLRAVDAAFPKAASV